jgi:serine O-acetyltransferase
VNTTTTPPATRNDLSFRRLVYLIASDLYREAGEVGGRAFLQHLWLGVGSKFMIWWRCAKFCRERGILFAAPGLLARFMVKRLSVKYGISIPLGVEIGPGFYIGHHGCIFVSPETVIGKNCNISQGVTIGVGNRGRVGVPRIGDNVYLGPGAKLFGRITVGNNVAIGANAVVSRHVKSNSIVFAAPTEVVATDDPSFPVYGSKGYVNWTDYDEKLQQ